MYESGHSGPPSREELRAALQRLEAALARHDGELRAALRAGIAAPRQVRRIVEMLREEVDRLRLLLA